MAKHDGFHHHPFIIFATLCKLFRFSFTLHKLNHRIREMRENNPPQADSFGVVACTEDRKELPNGELKETTNRDLQEMAYFGKAQQLKVCFVCSLFILVLLRSKLILEVEE